jgi:peptidoglycan-N-acetylglucosamine deacetylase
LILAIILIFVLASILYTLLPELLFHIWHLGTLYKGSATHRAIALTFDDGPDPRYTPQVLRILREHGAKATFFLVGDRAAAAPDLVQAILADGHEVASHSQKHQHAWTLLPVATWRNVFRAKATLESLTEAAPTGPKIRYYRPPWGAFNWITRIAASFADLKPVLWSVRAKDWYPGEYADDVVRRVVTGAHPGAIVLCHDGGGADGAPLNTIQALPKILTTLTRQGYQFVTVGEIEAKAQEWKQRVLDLLATYSRVRRILIRCWSLVEWVFARYYKIQGMNEMFRISPACWRFGTRTDENSGKVIVANGSKVIDLHFQNQSVITISAANDNRAVIRGLRMAKEGFQEVARVVQFDERYADVQAVMAVTLMNRGMEMLGFHVEDIPDGLTKRRLQAYMHFLLGFYHPEGFSRLKHGRHQLDLRLIWMSRDEMISRYGQHE